MRTQGLRQLAWLSQLTLSVSGPAWLSPGLPGSTPAMRQCYPVEPYTAMGMLHIYADHTAATSHMWRLRPWNVTSAMAGMKFYSYFSLNWVVCIGQPNFEEWGGGRREVTEHRHRWQSSCPLGNYPACQEGPTCRGPDRAHTQLGLAGAPEPHPEQRARAL